MVDFIKNMHVPIQSNLSYLNAQIFFTKGNFKNICRTFKYSMDSDLKIKSAKNTD